jgi:transposase InsO family protein
MDANSENNGMEIAENQQALEAAKEEVEKIWKNAENVAEVLSQIFADFGPPKILQTDNGREFKNSTVGSICEKFGVKFIHGTPRHSQSQGSIERSNQDVEVRIFFS